MTKNIEDEEYEKELIEYCAEGDNEENKKEFNTKNIGESTNKGIIIKENTKNDYSEISTKEKSSLSLKGKEKLDEIKNETEIKEKEIISSKNDVENINSTEDSVKNINLSKIFGQSRKDGKGDFEGSLSIISDPKKIFSKAKDIINLSTPIEKIIIYIRENIESQKGKWLLLGEERNDEHIFEIQKFTEYMCNINYLNTGQILQIYNTEDDKINLYNQRNDKNISFETKGNEIGKIEENKDYPFELEMSKFSKGEKVGGNLRYEEIKKIILMLVNNYNNLCE
uniref:HHH_8 domain-containing protein n=1 Tax=Meloidogyne hapla TaxID=6305 RepID=A0A1I8B0Q5_MELHA